MVGKAVRMSLPGRTCKAQFCFLQIPVVLDKPLKPRALKTGSLRFMESVS